MSHAIFLRLCSVLLHPVHPNNAPEALPLREQVERFVDLVETHLVRDELVQLKLLQEAR